MDLEWFKDTLKDELCGGKEYIKCAIETKMSNPNWSSTFLKMWEMKLDHAMNIYKMFIEHYQNIETKTKEVPEYIVELKHKMTECYTNGATTIANLKNAYNKM